MKMSDSKEVSDEKVKILIIEDNPVDLAYLQKLISLLPFSVEVSAVSVLTEVQSRKALFNPDLIISDIEVGEFNSLDFFQSNPQLTGTPMIICSNYTHFALPAFKLKAIHYLEKPIRADELSEAISRFLISKNIQKEETAQSPQKLLVATDRSTLFIEFSEIVFLKAEGGYTHIIKQDEEAILSSKNLGYYESLLPSSFLRTGKSNIINMDFVQAMHGGGLIEFKNKLSLEVSPKRRSEVQEKLRNYFMGMG